MQESEVKSSSVRWKQGTRLMGGFVTYLVIAIELTLFSITLFINMKFVCQLCIVTTSPRLFAGHRLSSSRLWTHLTVGGFEWSAVSVSCHPVCPPLWWNQLLRGSGRWRQTAELPGAFKWWQSAERKSQQVTWQARKRLLTLTCAV